MLSSARTLSKQVLNHRSQIQQQTKAQLRNQHNGALAKDQPRGQHEEEVHAVAKMRQENRERKKRWRELNEERNKDNDLRCRVNKRANQLYGARASPAKEKWIGEEFERRQQRRREKEQRRRHSYHQQTQTQQTQADGPEARAAEPRRLSAQGDAAAVHMPTGFGTYAMLPQHQVRAANDFWRCVADRHALEAAVPAETAGTVRLPPLSSVVPEELLLHSAAARRGSDAARDHHYQPPRQAASLPGDAPVMLPRGHVAPLCSGNAAGARASPFGAVPQAVGFDARGHMILAARPAAQCALPALPSSPQRHLRPWEDDVSLCAADDAASAAALPSPLTMYRPHSPDVGRLSEAAFSLMSLSSSPVAAMDGAPPTPP
ncbi:hypothetical protein LPJ61_004215 [Coemansia biformis]|uniref:DUF3020 domain-containing protein n=1 Tax=Coemansia biformis TaxID=1286918 RepID=A0A9W8CVK1_9FUNG|nr:hypothetical protein LPJ61_004215 [Coemansia biformis]